MTGVVTPGSEEESFWGHEGAGALLVARGTGRVFLVLRSAKVRNPGTWGPPGGAMEEGESPQQGAAREIREEVGYGGPLDLRPGHVFTAPGFTYHNFVGLVGGEFEPVLNWESSDAGWFDLDALPGPLHFGLREFLQSSAGLISSVVDEAMEGVGDSDLVGGLTGAMALEVHMRRLRSFSR